MSVGPGSILVVDDDEDVRNMICIVLSVEGYSTAGAADGVEALKRLRSGAPPALIIVDLMMPRMDGDALIRTLSADSSLARIPVAVVSGQIASDAQPRSPQIVAHLAKPIELDELLTVVHRATDRPD